MVCEATREGEDDDATIGGATYLRTRKHLGRFRGREDVWELAER